LVKKLDYDNWQALYASAALAVTDRQRKEAQTAKVDHYMPLFSMTGQNRKEIQVLADTHRSSPALAN